MPRARQLNPAETNAFMADHSTLPPEHAADIALKWRERCVNALTTFVPTPVQEIGQLGAAGAYAGSIGWWDGQNDAERTRLILLWRTKTAPELGINTVQNPTPFKDVVDTASGTMVHKAVADPRSFYGVNKTLIPTGVLVVTSIGLAIAGKGQMVNPYVKAGAIAGSAYVVGSTFRDLAYERRAKALASGTGNGNGAETTEGGAEGNPSYPRAVA